MASKTSSRNETTLGTLTQRFIELLYKSNFSVNLNEVSTKLNIKKRRLYDITNVLEGVGLLQKTSKNVTRWNGQYPPILYGSSTNPSSFSIKQEPPSFDNPNISNKRSITTSEDLEILTQRYRALEDKEKQLESDLQKHLISEYAYVTYNDIKSCFGNQVVIAVKAPPESKLEVNEQLQIWLKSEFGPIEVYLCPNYTHNASETPMNNNTSSNTIINNYQNITNIITNNPQDSQPSLPPPASYNGISSDEGRGTASTDQQYDPTLSSALSISEDEDTLKFLPFEAREEYNFALDNDYSAATLFPNDNLGLDD